MSLDWPHFTPAAALLGGALIGLAAVGCVLLLGRIAGISGVVAGILRHRPGETLWRVAFVGGLLAAPGLYALLLPLPALRVTSSWPLLIAAGFLVGIGTQYGSGCTSGHGVCGISRLSPRSIVATLAFMASGFLTVFIVRHVLA